MHGSSAFSPQSGFALPIYHLFIVVLIISAAILALVSGLVIYILFRYRDRGSGVEPKQNFGERRLETLWTVVPLLIVGALFVLTVRTMADSDPTARGRAPDIVLTGYQWWWDVQYAQSGVVTANEIHIPVGRPLLVRLLGGDVIHDFWVPELSRKEDLVPGSPNQLWLAADHAGLYEGACSEYCGAEHAWMRIRVIAEPEAQFQAWLRAQSELPRAPQASEAQRGAALFQQLTCANCHAVGGSAANARYAPDLTHVASRQTLAAGALTNSPGALRAWLHDPAEFKPSCNMPNLGLSSHQLDALTAYLESLR